MSDKKEKHLERREGEHDIDPPASRQTSDEIPAVSSAIFGVHEGIHLDWHLDDMRSSAPTEASEADDPEAPIEEGVIMLDPPTWGMSPEMAGPGEHDMKLDARLDQEAEEVAPVSIALQPPSGFGEFIDFDLEATREPAAEQELRPGTNPNQEPAVPACPGADDLMSTLSRTRAAKKAAAAAFGGDLRALRWLRSPNQAMGGHAPVSLLVSDEGLQQVLDVLGRVEHGVFS